MKIYTRAQKRPVKKDNALIIYVYVSPRKVVKITTLKAFETKKVMKNRKTQKSKAFNKKGFCSTSLF